MANVIKIKRYAAFANIPTSGYQVGEFIFALDTKQLFLCNSLDSKVEIGMNSSFGDYLKIGNNLSDLDDPEIARNNLSVFSKTEINNLLSGLNWKPDVMVVTTENIVLSGLHTIDGIAVPLNARVGVVKQTNQIENGIYISSSGAWYRSVDANSSPELVGATFGVAQGTLAETVWRVFTDNIVLGTTPIEIQQFNGLKSYIDGFGIKFVNGNEIQLDLTELGTATSMAADDEIIFIDMDQTGTSKMKRISRTNFLASTGMVSDTFKVKVTQGGTEGYLDEVTAATEGIKKGSGLPSTITFQLAVDGLTAETVVNPYVDLVPMFDSSADAHRKVTIANLVKNIELDGGSY